MRRFFILVSFLLVVTLWGCSSNTSSSPIAPTEVAFGLADLAEILFARGVPIDVGDLEDFGFFPVAARHFTISGEDVLVFEFGGTVTTEEVQSVVSPDGTTVNGQVIDWPATPHFFANGRVIVIYVGDSPQVIFGLQQILGPQVAGGAIFFEVEEN